MQAPLRLKAACHASNVGCCPKCVSARADCHGSLVPPMGLLTGRKHLSGSMPLLRDQLRCRPVPSMGAMPALPSSAAASTARNLPSHPARQITRCMSGQAIKDAV